MKSANGISGSQLAEGLSRIGYRVTRKTGRNMRLTADAPARHSITISNHESLKVEVLNAIVADIAARFDMTPQQLQRQLFDRASSTNQS